MKRRQRIIQKNTPRLSWHRIALLVMATEWWIFLYILITTINPGLVANVGISQGYLVLPVSVFFSLSLTACFLTNMMWRSLLWSFLFCLFLFLRISYLGGLLNFLLLLALGATIEFYFYTKETPVVNE